ALSGRASGAPPAPVASADVSRPATRVSSPSCERAGDVDGVGSRVTQPMPGKKTSTHECASRSRTTYSRRSASYAPGEKPAATRAYGDASSAATVSATGSDTPHGGITATVDGRPAAAGSAITDSDVSVGSVSAAAARSWRADGRGT